MHLREFLETLPGPYFPQFNSISPLHPSSCFYWTACESWAEISLVERTTSSPFLAHKHGRTGFSCLWTPTPPRCDYPHLLKLGTISPGGHCHFPDRQPGFNPVEACGRSLRFPQAGILKKDTISTIPFSTLSGLAQFLGTHYLGNPFWLRKELSSPACVTVQKKSLTGISSSALLWASDKLRG